MSFDTLIAKTRQTLADDAARAHVVLSAQGTLVGVTEVDIRTGAHSFKADEPGVTRPAIALSAACSGRPAGAGRAGRRPGRAR